MKNIYRKENRQTMEKEENQYIKIIQRKSVQPNHTIKVSFVFERSFSHF